jgi:chemotaxis protein methyltransferase CheR
MPELPVASMELMNITDAEFHSIRDLVYNRFGITLSDQKKSLVVGRLQKKLKEHECRTFKQYYDMLVADKTDSLISELANQITTNHTFFFREPDHFDFFKSDILPWMVKTHQEKKDNDLRIWCAAASSGEEPYTLVITLLEYFGMDYKKWNCGLLATDVSEKALAGAIEGIYVPARMQGVPPAILHKYFKKAGDGYAVIDQLKKEVTYRRFNLMNKTLPFKKKFDCIWCRNVMIYFDTPTKHELVNRMYDKTVDGGYLLIGHAETLDRSQTKWKYVKPAVYRKE